MPVEREAMKAGAPREQLFTKAQAGWTPVQYQWKFRVPLIAVPVLIGLQNWHAEHPNDVLGSPLQHVSVEVLLLVGLALGTGYLRLPFSITWWLVLLAAYAIQTRFLLGVATVLSLSVLLTWYGLRLQHADAISALWAGAPMTSGCRVLWQLWDLCVHLCPALMMLYSHGPSLGLTAPPKPGMVTTLSALVALPMSLLWLLGLSLGLPREATQEKKQGGLSLSRHAYRVSSELPKEAWTFVHASHGMVCLAWLLALLLPGTALGATGLFMLMGRVKQPFTTAWWCMFATCMWFNYGPGPSRLVAEPSNLRFLEGLCCICALTMSTGFYGAQVFSPLAFRSMVLNWAVRPMARCFPSMAKPLLLAAETRSFWIMARLGDSMLHLIPSIVAVCLFHSSLTFQSALCALPMNLIWLASAGATSLEALDHFAQRDDPSTLPEDPVIYATNELYGLEPRVSRRCLHFVYGSHWALCTGACALCLLH